MDIIVTRSDIDAITRVYPLASGAHGAPVEPGCPVCAREALCLAIAWVRAGRPALSDWHYGGDGWTDRPERSPTDAAAIGLNDGPWSSAAAAEPWRLRLALLRDTAAPAGWVDVYRLAATRYSLSAMLSAGGLPEAAAACREATTAAECARAAAAARTILQARPPRAAGWGDPDRHLILGVLILLAAHGAASWGDVEDAWMAAAEVGGGR